MVDIIPWDIVISQLTFPVAVIGTIPLDHRLPEPNMLARRFRRRRCPHIRLRRRAATVAPHTGLGDVSGHGLLLVQRDRCRCRLLRAHHHRLAVPRQRDTRTGRPPQLPIVAFSQGSAVSPKQESDLALPGAETLCIRYYQVHRCGFNFVYPASGILSARSAEPACIRQTASRSSELSTSLCQFQ